MRKKLTLMFVALIAVAAFAATHALNQVRDEATSVADVAALNALDNGTAFTFTGNAVVVANVIKGTNRYVYIKDATGSSLIYDSNGNKTADWAVGKTITPEWAGKVSVYNKLFEVVPDAALTVLDADAEAVAYDEVTLADVTAANMNKVVKLTDVTIASVSGSNFTIKKGDASVAGYNQFAVTGLANGLVCSEMIGAISVYNDNVQFQPISFTVGTPAPEPADITISPASGDISAALAEATALKTAKNITINLTANGAYTVTAPIVASANVTINGADGATIDASGLSGAFINYASINGAKAMKDGTTESAYTIVESVTIKDVTINGLANSIINNASGAKTLFKKISVNNAVIELSGNKNVFALGTAYANDLTIENSTLWSKTSHTGFLFKADGKPADVNASETTTWTINKSTLVNIAVGKKANNSNGGIKGKKTTTMVLTSSILVNFASNKGNEVNGWLWGQNGGANSSYANNIYWSAATDGEVVPGWTDATKGGSDQTNTSLSGDPEFEDAANGDFHVGASTLAAKNSTGDPRWLTEFVPLTVTVAEDIENGSVTVDKASAATGETITITATPDKLYKLGTITVTDADGNDVEVDGTTFVMPAANVTVSATFEYNIPSEATAAIDVEVPANLGKMDGTTDATDLALFLDSYLQDSQNPAYIKLTLKPGAEYTISKPLSVMTAIAIEGDESNPATIDASNLAGAFVQIDGEAVAAEPNDKGFFTGIYDVTFKNFEVTGLSGSLFNANSQKYLIPTFTMENVLVEMTTNLPSAPMLEVDPTDESAAGAAAVIDMTGSVVENLVVTKSTMNGATLAYKATTDAATAGVTAQTIKASYNTFYKSTGIQLGAIEYGSGAPALSNKIAPAATNVSIDFNHNVVIGADNFVLAANVDPASMVVQYNSFVTEAGQDVSATVNIPNVAGTIEGDLVFAAPDEVANGNLALGACPQKTAKIGDPRWLNAAMKVTPAAITGAGGDLAAVINQGVKDGFMKFQLEENARYSVKQPIVATTGLVITGENVRIDVDHDDVFIKLASEPTAPYMKKYTAAASAPALNRAPAADETDYYAFNELKLKGLQITGLKNSIIYDNNVKYCVVDLTIDDCVLALETEAVENEALISFKAGGAKDFTIKNSTVYGNNAVAKYFIRYNNSARLDRYGFNKDADFQTMTYQNNTFYGLLKSDGQWGNYNGISGQNYSKFVVEKNIWYNCGKDLIRRMAGGRFGNGAPLTFDKNTYFNDGADISASEASYDKSGTALMSDPSFKKPGDGDFTLSAYAEQCVERTGDPRWFANGGHYNNATAIEGMTTETADDDAPMYNLSGQRVTKSYKGIVIKNGKKVMVK